MPLSMVDPAFARGQIELMLSDVYLHPSGRIPAYEWNFGDVNPGARLATLSAFAAGPGRPTALAFPTFTEAVSMAAQKICRTLGIGRFPQAWSYLRSDE